MSDLDLRSLSEPITVSASNDDYAKLRNLFESGFFVKKDQKVSNQLKCVTRNILTSTKDKNDLVQSHSDAKRQLLGLLLTILRPEEVEDDHEMVFSAVDYIGTSNYGETRYRLLKNVIRAASSKPGVLYYYLLKQKEKEMPLDYLTAAFRWCVNLQRLHGASNILYISADMPKCTLAHIISSSLDLCMLPIAFAMIEIGIFCYHKNCVEDSRTIDTKFNKLICRVKEQPLSLQQLARLTIRKTLRDVDVVRGSYELPLPRILQDYVSLRCLNATISSMFLETAEPVLHDITQTINDRYNMDYRITSSPYLEGRKRQWRIEDDYSSLEEEFL